MNILLLLILITTPHIYRCLDNGLGRTPPMGWNSWYDLECTNQMNEDVVKSTADSFIQKGLAKVGYTYINLDDCWAKGRFPNGTVYSDPASFPSGIRSLAQYVKSKGLKLGVYTDRGTYTCGGRPGSLGYEKIDAETYAEWGVEYVKEDSCYASQDHETAFKEYGMMRDSLNATGKHIYFSLCGWNPWYAPPGWSLGNSWRIGPDDTTWENVIVNINIDAELNQYARPGGWNDPCLLLSKSHSNQRRITPTQTRTQFNMWSILSAPLLISGDIIGISEYDLETYTNPQVIAVNQDPLGKQGIRLVGGPLSTQKSSSGPVFLSDCDDPSKQTWIWDVPMKGFLVNGNSNLCLNVNDCGSLVIYYPCVVSGGTCAGSNSYANEQFKLSQSGSLVSDLNQKCVSSQGGVVQIDDCIAGNLDQVWEYDPASKTLKNKGKCLTVASSSTNVWGRELSDGSWAVVFINVGPSTVNVTCDNDCFNQMGFDSNAHLTIRDLWKNTVIYSFPYLTSSIDGNGGSAMFKVTRAKNF